MDAAAVDHDRDGIAEIAIGEPRGRDAVLGDLLAGLQAADRRPIKWEKRSVIASTPRPTEDRAGRSQLAERRIPAGLIFRVCGLRLALLLVPTGKIRLAHLDQVVRDLLPKAGAHRCRPRRFAIVRILGAQNP